MGHGWNRPAYDQSHGRKRRDGNQLRIPLQERRQNPCWITEKRFQLALVDALPKEPTFDERARIDDFPESLVVGENKSFDVNHLLCEGIQVFPVSEGPPMHLEDAKALILYGTVKYRDRFSDTRETRFGFKIRPHTKLERIRSMAYNDNK